MARRRKRFFFLRIAALMSSQGNKHLFKMGGIKLFESSLSLIIQNLHHLHEALSSSASAFDGRQGGLYHQPLWKEN